MTGKEYIRYILENDLENQSIFNDDGTLRGFITDAEAAIKFGVGRMTIAVWVNQELIEGVRMNNVLMIPVTAKDPREVKHETTKTSNNNGGFYILHDAAKFYTSKGD